MLGAGIREAKAGREGAEGSCGDLAFAVSEVGPGESLSTGVAA